MEIDLLVITPYGLQLQVKAERVTIPTCEGEVQAGANHSPIVAKLQAGIFSVASVGKPVQHYYLDQGYASLGATKIIITVEIFENQKDLNMKRAQSSQERAWKRLADRSGSVDINRSLESLERAKARLRLTQLL